MTGKVCICYCEDKTWRVVRVLQLDPDYPIEPNTGWLKSEVTDGHVTSAKDWEISTGTGAMGGWYSPGTGAITLEEP